MGETSKARPRRLREGCFERYIRGRGIDIGCGDDPLTEDCDRWDLLLGCGDVTHVATLPDESYSWAYSSRLLEHLVDPLAALRRWWRILQTGGHLTLFVPHRDLYEKRRTLPSRFNADHKCFLLPDRDDSPHTLSLARLLGVSTPGGRLLHIRTCDEGHTITDPDCHSDGEYSIEAVARKLDRVGEGDGK